MNSYLNNNFMGYLACLLAMQKRIVGEFTSENTFYTFASVLNIIVLVTVCKHMALLQRRRHSDYSDF